ncbi:ATP-binding cassette domain-containing protein [Streptosporangium sp. NPDC002721]|uniref:ATP-binding cassette domain-containing protein n=1 Tax=Streptosporangium sp. NPDC002721 TaxID=3366188 RepID=UPI00368B9330
MIRTSGLTRHFTVRKETVEAVRGLDLHVASGEMVALLGPNGAGKSTTLRMLTTLLPPTSGSAEVAGHDVTTGQRGVRARIGYIGQGNGAAHNQRGRDELISQGRAYGLGARASRDRAAELIASLDLEGVADRTVSSLSGGQRRRLDIAMGLIHAPDLLFLDEPSTGLDPQNRANLSEHIRALRAEHGTTIVLTTHYLDEADQLAERVIVIDHGRIIADDTPARLKADHAGDRVTLSFGGERDARRAVTESLGVVAGARVERTGARVVIEVAGGVQLAPKLLRGLDEAGVEVTGVEVTRPTLDDVFLNLTGRSLREDGTSGPGTADSGSGNPTTTNASTKSTATKRAAGSGVVTPEESTA